MDQEHGKQVEMNDCGCGEETQHGHATNNGGSNGDDNDGKTEDGNTECGAKDGKQLEADFCFSGGGIRACALAAGVFDGVVRTQPTDGTKPEIVYRPRFYSCVSGGGYFGGFLASVAAQLGASAADAGDDKWLEVLKHVEALPQRSNFLVDFDAHNGQNACFACLRGCGQLLAMIGVVTLSLALFAVKYFTVAVVAAEVLALFGSIKYDEELANHGTLRDNSNAARGMQADIGIGALVMTLVGLMMALAMKTCLPPALAASTKPWAGALLLAGLHLAVIWGYRGLDDSGGADELVDSVVAIFIGLSLLLGNRTFTLIAIVMVVTAHVVVVRLWHSVSLFGYQWKYDKDTWEKFLWACAASMLLMPIILWVDYNKMRWWYQWRLADSFDLNKVKHKELKDTKFIAGIAVHRWQYTEDIEGGIIEPTHDAISVDLAMNHVIRARSVRSRAMTTLPTRITMKQPESLDEFNRWNHPRLQCSESGFSLMETVAISGSAIAEEFGTFPAGQTFPIIVKLAGCSMGAWMERHVEKGSKAPALTLLRCGYAVVPGMVLVCFFLLWGLYIAADTTVIIRCLIFALTVLYVAMLLWIVSCGNSLRTGCSKNSLGCWCYDTVALTLHSLFEMVELSDEFPEVTYLTDGGHVDNTGLIAYLAAMLNRDVEGGTVFMVDGTLYKDGLPFHNLEAVLEDAQHRLGAKICRNRVTMVAYDEDGNKCAGQEFSGGTMEAITHVRNFPKEARHVVVGPIKLCVPDDDGVDGNFHYSEPFDVYFGRLLSGPSRNKAPGMCCECCHTCCNACGLSRACSHVVFGEFPSHTTPCQFFTETLFQEYQDAATRLGQSMRELALTQSKCKPYRDSETELDPLDATV